MAAEPDRDEGERERLIEEFGQVMQAYQRSADTLDQRLADRLGLNRTDLRCLELIFAPAPLSPGELAAAAGLTTGGVTTAIDRLERTGYATRVRDTKDRRRVTVQPTDKSYAVLTEVFTPIFEEGAAYLRQFDIPTLRLMTEFMRFAARQQETHATRLAGHE